LTTSPLTCRQPKCCPHKGATHFLPAISGFLSRVRPVPADLRRSREQGQGAGSGSRVREQGQGAGSGSRVREQGQGAGSGSRVRSRAAKPGRRARRGGGRVAAPPGPVPLA
jgi:hypothetical protein